MNLTVTTVHLIFDAHLAPVRLWPWQVGVAEALPASLAACRIVPAELGERTNDRATLAVALASLRPAGGPFRVAQEGGRDV